MDQAMLEVGLCANAHGCLGFDEITTPAKVDTPDTLCYSLQGEQNCEAQGKFCAWCYQIAEPNLAGSASASPPCPPKLPQSSSVLLASFLSWLSCPL